MSDSDDSRSLTRLPSFTSNIQEGRRSRSPLISQRGNSSRSRSGNRSRSRNRMFNRSAPTRTEDYFGAFNPSNGPGYHSPPILEDDDELRDILADQPQLPDFGTHLNAGRSMEPDSRRKAIEDEMDDDARGVFDMNLHRDTDTVDMPPEITSPPKNEAPKVKFYNSSDDETTEDEDGDLKKSNSRADEGSSSGTANPNEKDEDDEDDDDEDKEPTFRDRFKRKMSLAFKGDTDLPDIPGEENLLNRIMKLGDVGGLVPGASKADPEKVPDEEADPVYGANSIPLQEMGPAPDDLADHEARGIIKEHDFYQNRDSSGSTFDFYNNNPEYNLRDGLDDFDIGALDGDSSMVDAPKKVQAGVLSSLLKMYLNPAMSQSSQTLGKSDGESILSGQTTPFGKKYDMNPKDLKTRLKKMGSHMRTASQTSIFNSDEETSIPGRAKSDLKKSTTKLTGLLYPHQTKAQRDNQQMLDSELNMMPSFHSTRPKAARKKKLLRSKRENVKAKITVHIADILLKQRFILRICKALMLYGAPTHRLEEYMQMTARVLEIDGQFVYFPGVMIVSFGDAATRTSEVQVVRCSQGLDLSKLYDAHKVYKAVVHDLMGVEEASAKIDELLLRTPLYPPWLCVFFYGFGSAMVTTWGFRGGWKDMPISFGIGLCVGFLQFYVSPRSSLYSNVFEVSASIVVSFIARALGTIHHGRIFCFGGIVQGSLALILPGYIILCGSLELQSRNMVAGSVRMFYAIIYSLFLGFGITLGASLYGWIDHNATSDTTCPDSIQLSPWFRFLFVPMFAIALGLINQARISQLPVMVLIAGLGYVVTYFSGKHFSSATEFTAAIGAFVIGILGNLYSRIGRGMAVSAMLPAIFVQVPSGVASQSSLLAGVLTADNIVNNQTITDQGTSLSFGVTMVQVAIGISVGLFAAAIVVYPLGKKRTGLFTL